MVRIVEQYEVVNHFNDLIRHGQLEVFLDNQGKVKAIINGRKEVEVNDSTMKEFVDNNIMTDGHVIVEEHQETGSQFIIDKVIIFHLVRKVCKIFSPYSDLKPVSEYLK